MLAWHLSTYYLPNLIFFVILDMSSWYILVVQSLTFIFMVRSAMEYHFNDLICQCVMLLSMIESSECRSNTSECRSNHTSMGNIQVILKWICLFYLDLVFSKIEWYVLVCETSMILLKMPKIDILNIRCVTNLCTFFHFLFESLLVSLLLAQAKSS